MLATTDMLTGLLNRRAFLERVTEVVRDRRPGAPLVLDAGHFMRVNDTWGHAGGDACLVAISDHLCCHVLEGDVVGRLGGEEFGVFLPDATREQAVAMAERLCRAVVVEAEGLEERCG